MLRRQGNEEEANDDFENENAEGGEQSSLEEALGAHGLLGDDTPGS